MAKQIFKAINSKKKKKKPDAANMIPSKTHMQMVKLKFECNSFSIIN